MAKKTCGHETDTHCIHSSERKSFRSCKQRWYWTHVKGLVPYSPIKPLEFGIAIHKGMEHLFDPDTWGKLSIEKKLERALKAFDDENDEQRRRFLKQPFTKDYLDDYEDRKQLGAGMLSWYARQIHPYSDKWFKPIRTEVSFHVPLWDGEGNELRCYNSPECGQVHEQGAKITLDGRLDVLIQDLVNGGYFILDWKTATQLLNSANHLYLDDQIGTYIAALSKELGIDIKGFLYIELAKFYPMAPKKNTRKTKGKMYSVSKTQSTNFELAELTFKLYDKEAYEEGLYNEYLEYLKSGDAPRFHQRFAIRQTDTKSANVLINASLEATEMTRVDLPIYPSPGKFTCQGCPFYEPCVEKLNGEDYEWTLEENYVGA